VIVKIPSSYTINSSAGLVVSVDLSSVPGFKIYSFTGGSGTFTVGL
jgi:hypothetical protein